LGCSLYSFNLYEFRICGGLAHNILDLVSGFSPLGGLVKTRRASPALDTPLVWPLKASTNPAGSDLPVAKLPPAQLSVRFCQGTQSLRHVKAVSLGENTISLSDNVVTAELNCRQGREEIIAHIHS
jgi:hypothetical protein